MNFQIKPQQESVTLGSLAHAAIEKQFRKSVKHHHDVLADQDPEPLHQMRVGMRRLRTAIQVFGFAVQLPKGTSERQIRSFAQTLGEVRDRDVMEAELTSHSELPKAEQAALKRVLKKLHKQRSRYFNALQSTLHSKKYKAFKHGFESWLAAPSYEAIAQLSIDDVLPDLLLPLISDVLLHPAWLVGVEFRSGEKKFAPLTPELIQQQLTESGNQLHDLRKRMKRVRYQTELFLDFYDDAYRAQVDEFKAIQEVLGQVQDSVILQTYLDEHLSDDLEKTCPTFANNLDEKRLQAWQQWRSLQEKYLDATYRSQVRQQIVKSGAMPNPSPIC